MLRKKTSYRKFEGLHIKRKKSLSNYIVDFYCKPLKIIIKLDSDFNMGGMKMSYYELICFTIYREASIIGQLALWRRLLGYPAMKYD